MKAIDAKKRLEEVGPFDVEVNEELLICQILLNTTRQRPRLLGLT